MAAATGLVEAGAAEAEAVPLKRRLVPMGSIMWERDVAEVYDQTYRAKFEPSVLDPIVDLMARIAGFRLRDRWAGWDRAPFTSGSESQVAVFEKES